MKPKEIPADIKNHLEYDPETGMFRWIKRRPGRKFMVWHYPVIGGGRYRTIGFENQSYRAHRVAYFLMTGQQPDDQLDHINRIKHDNRWCNLRVATRYENMANRQSTGVWRHRSKFAAQICVHGKKHFIGVYATKDQAMAAYYAERQRLYGEFAYVPDGF